MTWFFFITTPAIRFATSSICRTKRTANHVGDTFEHQTEPGGTRKRHRRFAGRHTASAATAGFEFLYRDFTSDIPPVALFTQAGTLYPSTVAFSEVDSTVGQLWVQKKFDNRFGIQAGKLFPLAYYDYLPLKNFRTEMALNLTLVPLRAIQHTYCLGVAPYFPN